MNQVTPLAAPNSRSRIPPITLVTVSKAVSATSTHTSGIDQRARRRSATMASAARIAPATSVYDLVSSAIGDREPGVLRGDGLQRDVAEDMDRKQRGQRRGTPPTLEPWCDVPDGHRREHRETGRLGERLGRLQAHGRASCVRDM